MKSKGVEYKFTAKPWFSGWHFVSFPKEMANEIRENLKFLEEGWGRMKVIAQIGNSEWETAIWFDTKHKTYLLPIKTAIRKKENVEVDKDVEIIVWI